MYMGKTMKAPFSTLWTGALAVDITIHDINLGKELEMHNIGELNHQRYASRSNVRSPYNQFYMTKTHLTLDLFTCRFNSNHVISNFHDG
jgi:hypothetical protein